MIESKSRLSFDGGRDLTDPNTLLHEVFEDRAALDRQEELPEVANVMEIFEEVAAGEPEATVFRVSSWSPGEAEAPRPRRGMSSSPGRPSSSSASWSEA